MPSEQVDFRFLLDERYPAWLTDDLAADGIDAVALNAHRPELRGLDDGRVLEAAIAEGRIVVTENVTTLSTAKAAVPEHPGVVYCHHARFPRTRPGLNRLGRALVALVSTPPDGLGKHPSCGGSPTQTECTPRHAPRLRFAVALRRGPVSQIAITTFPGA